MTHEYKPVLVNWRQRLASEGKAYPKSSCASCASCGQFSPNWRECESMLSRPVPQPPELTGEPEVLGYLDSALTYYPSPESVAQYGKGRVMRELVDRAHLAPLQAEIKQLKSWQEAVRKNSPLLIQLDQLKALLAEAMHFEVGELDQDSWEDLRRRVSALSKSAA